MRAGDSRVDQQCLGSTANAGATHLGVDNDVDGHVEIGGFVHVDVAEAFQMGKHRYARLRLHACHKTLAAARHDHIDGTVEAGQQGTNSGAVGHRHDLDRLFRQTAAASPLHRQR